MPVQPRKIGAPLAPEIRPGLRVAICGEVNAGKSTVLNALLRRRLLPNNIGETIRPRITARHRARPGAEIRHPDGRIETLEAGFDPERLRGAAEILLWSDAPQIAGLEFVELPMTTADAVTEADLEVLSRVDAMVWVTIASQAWRLTEKSIIGRLKTAMPAHSLIVVSRADKMRSAADLEKLEGRVRRETEGLFDAFALLKGAARTLDAAAGSQEDWDLSGAPGILEILRGFAPEGSLEYPETEEATEIAEPENLIDLDSFRKLAPVQSRVAQADTAPCPPAAAVQGAPASSPASWPTPGAEAGIHPAHLARLREIAMRLPDGAVSGLLWPGDERPCTVLCGVPERCQEAAQAFGSSLGRLGTAYVACGFDARPETVIISTAGIQIACGALPGTGMAFIMAAADRMNAGIARSMIQQMRNVMQATAG